ncbi:PA0069 family radical SAM protein [Sediminicurvatus halobius]|uniref:Radical SAM protein n=1 Tax=Sediminicurvatus halobius TaxID=2182432 RepID=A0A2U2MXY2_9GAMM|nr:PA0069 family radical SAM protein [Spiribacter halobius]PWG61643.1 radical SAM protein [Spiribacter halobius]UEX79459.1 PA0069 family radical SAM protein [Spiribacter halobius]
MSEGRAPLPPRPQRGRGAVSNREGRFARQRHEPLDSDWSDPAGEVPESSPRTTVAEDRSRRVITYNRSPDIGFDRSLNPYRGCEHGCIYCYARPSHSYLDLSPGLDFETRLFQKPDAPEQLARELRAEGYRPAPIALGVNTDAWQPVEKRLRLTRRILEVLLAFRHPVRVISKSVLIERDLDLLAALAEQGLVTADVSVTTLDDELNRRLEPRAAGGRRRLAMIRRLAAAGVPTSVLMAPVIPALNDHEIECVLEAGAEAGAAAASYVILRLPHEVAPLFEEWLETHYPQRAAHVLSLVSQLHGGRTYRAEFGSRMRGSGELATLIAQRFNVARRRHGLAESLPQPRCDAFQPPPAAGDQLGLF